MEGCYLGEFTGRSQSDFTGIINKKEVEAIAVAIKALNIPKMRLQRPPTYDVYQFATVAKPIDDLPTCNMSIAEAWSKRTFNITYNRELVNIKGNNHRNNWVCHARRALRMAARAFRLVDIPMIPSDGTALGWYRGACHT
jgi:hypothetical protein